MKNTEVKPYTGTPTEWAYAIKITLKSKLATLEELNQTNHLALEHKAITLEHFQKAAQVLAAEILKR